MNKNAIPNDPQTPFVTSGIRLGTAALTTRGFKEQECQEIGQLIARLLDHPNDHALLRDTAHRVQALCNQYPVYV